MFSQYWIANEPGSTVTAAQADYIAKLARGETYVAPTASTAMAGTITITAAQTGKTIFLGATTEDVAISLPAEADGLNYKLVYTNSAAEAQEYTIGTGSAANYFIGGVSFHHVGSSGSTNAVAGVYSDGNSNSLITINNAEAGTEINLHCNGTAWYLWGKVVSDTIPTIADT